MGHIFDRDSYLEGLEEKKILISKLDIVLEDFRSYLLQAQEPYSSLDAIYFSNQLLRIASIIEKEKHDS